MLKFFTEEFECNAQYRKIFSRCEDIIDETDMVREISDFSRFIIQCINVNDLISKRKENFKYLKKELQSIEILPVCNFQEGDCPFVFPIRIANRDKFRKYLMENRIYCAVHWPFDGFMEKERKNAVFNSDTLISLPIDQRYDIKEMDYMLNVIKAYEG